MIKLSGWRKSDTKFITQAIKEQDASIQTDLDQKMYDVVGTLSILGYKSEAFYRVRTLNQKLLLFQFLLDLELVFLNYLVF